MFSRFRRSSRSVRFEETQNVDQTFSEPSDAKVPAPHPSPEDDLKYIQPFDDSEQLVRRPSLARRLSNTFLRRKSSTSSVKADSPREDEELPPYVLVSWGRNDYGQLLRKSPVTAEVSLAQDTDGAPIEETLEMIPFQTKAFSSNIANVAPGLFHSLASTSRGVLWGGGDNEDGQLDKTASATHFQTLKQVKGSEAIQDKVTTSLAVGLKHCALATKDGLVLTWGSNESGQLGHSKTANNTSVAPRLLDGNVRRERAVQVACSEGATFVLTEKGQVWSTGEGTRGELGRPEALETGCSWMASPILGRLFCTPVSMLATGAAHVVAVTATGKAYGWGWNRHGQLGFSSTNGRFEASPVALAEVSASPIIWAACGTSHTALVTMDEHIFTAGANEHGQLGRISGVSSAFGEVLALKDKGVIKASCGAYHTIALTRQGKLFGFGSNEFGEIVPSMEVPADGNTGDLRRDPVECSIGPEGFAVIDVIAGGLCTFALVARNAEDGPRLLQTRMSLRPRLFSLDADMLQKLVAEANKTKSMGGLKGALLEFHATGLNRSFVLTTKKSRVDVAGVFTSFDAMWKAMQTKRDSERLMNQSFAQLHQELLDLAAVATESDQLRAFFIALLNPACEWMPSPVYGMLVKALASLKDDGLDIIAQWCIADLDPEAFSARIIKHLVRIVDFAAQKRDWSAKGCAPAAVRVLSSLHKHSLACGFIPLERFCVQQPNEWSKHVIIEEWRRFQKRERNAPESDRAFASGLLSREKDFSLFEHPFVLSVEAKRKIIMYEQQQTQLEHAVLTALQQRGSPFLEITVRRDHLFQDACETLLRAHREDLQKPLRVEFEGEPGLDWGGVGKEFFGLLSETLFDPKERDMFCRPDPDNRPNLLWLNARGKTARNLRAMEALLQRRKDRLLKSGAREDPSFRLFLANAVQCPGKCHEAMTANTMLNPGYFCDVCGSALRVGHLAYSCRTCNYDSCEACHAEELPEVTEAYRQVALVGVLMGLAVYHTILLDVQFPLALYQALLNRSNETKTTFTLAELAEIDPVLAKGLQSMLDFPADDPDLFLASFEGQTFYVEDADFELEKGGKEVQVTLENRERYVKRRCEFELREGVSGLLTALTNGFKAVVNVDGDAFRLFSDRELELMVVGVPDLDMAALRAVARYEGFDEKSPVITWFWDLCENELSMDEKQKLLHFITGSGKAPVGGLGNQDFLIQRAGPDSNQLPTAHTCFYTLLLPEYTSKAKLKQKLFIALNNSEGFGLQ